MRIDEAPGTSDQRGTMLMEHLVAVAILALVVIATLGHCRISGKPPTTKDVRALITVSE